MEVLQIEVILGGRGFGAPTDEIPERVAGSLVGDQRDRHARRGGGGRTRRGRRRTPLVPRTCCDRDRQHREDIRNGHSRHRSTPPTRAAATTPRSGGHTAIIAGNRPEVSGLPRTWAWFLSRPLA